MAFFTFELVSLVTHLLVLLHWPIMWHCSPTRAKIKKATYVTSFGLAVLSRTGYAIEEHKNITLCSFLLSTSPPSSNLAGATQVQLALPRNATLPDDDDDEDDDLPNR